MVFIWLMKLHNVPDVHLGIKQDCFMKVLLPGFTTPAMIAVALCIPARETRGQKESVSKSMLPGLRSTDASASVC